MPHNLDSLSDLSVLANGLQFDPLPSPRPLDPSLSHAPKLNHELTSEESVQAVVNALRYFPNRLHAQLAGEFARELETYGHIYMYRFRPDRWLLRARPISKYPAKCLEAAALMLMICNNLDESVAQFPEELVTYGGNGQVFSNWAQFWLVMQALSRLTKELTLILYSGHPLGLFPSPTSAPRLVITNGMLVPKAGQEAGYNRLFALGVSQYGQMTAGSYCYIGPQGIVHGTTLTLLNALRKKNREDQSSQGMSRETRSSEGCENANSPGWGKVFITSGLGGMSGAQAKAGVIIGCIAVIAEVCEKALKKRLEQGWLTERVDSLNELIERIRHYRKAPLAVSIGYLGNVVEVWERLAEIYRTTGELLVDIGSDQTSCHNPFQGGYYPVGISYEAARSMMAEQPENFKHKVFESLRRQMDAINCLTESGLYFFDYGNAFLLQAKRAGADVSPSEVQLKEARKFGMVREFRYPSYVQDIMGDIFSLGFGPFRWVCTSGLPEDLSLTDYLAAKELRRLMQEKDLPMDIYEQYKDNLDWIEHAQEYNLVVGSQARILYSDEAGRISIAMAFNRAVSEGQLKGPLVISRDHHDVSGTDSPYRETSNIYDGSAVCADMAVQNCIGTAIRGATWVALHNGGGVGWCECINGGFGHLLDGTYEAGQKARSLLAWDVTNGLARRAWSGHPLARMTIERAKRRENASTSEETRSNTQSDYSMNGTQHALEVELPHMVEDRSLIEKIVKATVQKK